MKWGERQVSGLLVCRSGKLILPPLTKHEPGRERTVFGKYGVGFKNNMLEVLHSHDIPEANGCIKRFK